MFDEKPWLKHYEQHVPATIDYPDITLPEAMAETVRKYPDFPIMIYRDREIGYQEFGEATDRFAAALQKLGVDKGDRVAIHLPNCPQFPITYFATLLIGAIAVPCNPVYTAREMTHQLIDSGAKVIVTLSPMYSQIKKIREKTQLEHVVVAKIKTFFPTITRFLFSIALEKKLGHRISIDGEVGTSWFSDLIKKAPEKPSLVTIHPDDTAVLMYTGGTTGISKGARLTHRNILVNALQVRVWVNSISRELRVLTTLPLFHSYGMTCCMNPAALFPGTMILIPDPRNVDDILKNIQKHRPDMYPGVPALYVSINNHADVQKYDLTSIELCNSGAAPLPPEVQQRFSELTGARLVEGYGLSEASPVTHGNPATGENRIGTIGLPWPDTEVKIVDAETGDKVLGVGDVGELCIRGPQIMKGYWNLPTETANALRTDPLGGAPWLYTGDMAVMDKDGYFNIVDRKKDMILGAGGFNIYPREIEDVLYEHPKILEAAAVGIPVEGKGERVKIFIVLKPDRTATEEEILDFCREYLAPHKVPRMVEFREGLPKSQVGKVLKRLLVEEEIRESAA